MSFDDRAAGPTRPPEPARTDQHEGVINREQHHRADPVRVGELQIWDVVNPPDHPFHLHGFFFQVLG